MAVPDWVSYVSLAGGVIGTVSGCLAYRRTGQLKMLDLRLELRRADENLRQLIDGLRNLLQRANQSRENPPTAQSHPGTTPPWADLDADIAKADAIAAAVPPAMGSGP